MSESIREQNIRVIASELRKYSTDKVIVCMDIDVIGFHAPVGEIVFNYYVDADGLDHPIDPAALVKPVVEKMTEDTYH